jgi:D-alanine-D-alanine ligase
MPPNYSIAAVDLPVARAPGREPAVAMVDLLSRQLLDSARLAVVFGGNKSVAGAVLRKRGNPRSWKSYEAVACDIAASLKRLGARNVEVMPDDMRLASSLSKARIDLAWLNTGGVQGHNAIAHAPAMLEMLGIPYIGHDPLTAATLDNKFYFKRQMIAMGIPTAPFLIWTSAHGNADPGRSPQFARTFAGWSDGFIVKPITGRASLHVHHVETASEIGTVAREVLAITQNPVLIEAYLPGREYCIAVSGPIIARQNRLDRLPRPFAFAALERVLESGEAIFTSMDQRPITRDRLRPLDPVREALQIDTLEDLASRLYLEFPLSTLVRLDVRADARGRLFVLEANPKPDLKAAEGDGTSLIGAGLERCGMSYDDLIFALFANRSADLLDDEAGITAAINRLIDL